MAVTGIERREDGAEPGSGHEEGQHVEGRVGPGGDAVAVAHAQSRELVGHAIGSLVELIEPAWAAAREAGESEPDAVARRNVRLQVEELKARGPILSQHAASGQLEVVGALYDLATGEVEFFD